jgi:hypothetical protein
MYPQKNSTHRLKKLKYRNMYIKIDRNRMLDIVIHYFYVWNIYQNTVSIFSVCGVFKKGFTIIHTTGSMDLKYMGLPPNPDLIVSISIGSVIGADSRLCSCLCINVFFFFLISIAALVFVAAAGIHIDTHMQRLCM